MNIPKHGCWYLERHIHFQNMTLGKLHVRCSLEMYREMNGFEHPVAIRHVRGSAIGNATGNDREVGNAIVPSGSSMNTGPDPWGNP